MDIRWVCGLLLVGTCQFFQPAHAQNSSHLFVKKTLSNGCSIALLKTQRPTEILRYQGACQDKLAVGDWVFSTHPLKDASGAEIAGGTVYLGRVENGAVDSGLWMTFYGDRGGITVIDSEKSAVGVQSVWFIKGFSKRDTGFSKLELIALIDKAIGVSEGKRLPTPNRDKLLVVANQWFDSPEQFADRWLKPLQGGSLPQTDDPKVFGRGARSG